MGVRSVIRDLLFIYLAYKLMRIWILNEPFSASVGILTIFLVAVTVWFLIEKVAA